ncbi:hypothetical protein [Archaeoglobus veneficus]|uniref:DUF5673 domain-containing protein n=1 Tax=Archaeoglobus veneficus (strain DSM 11195 / SNP6) TaxID=693661 RepID=F2KNQ4_ARCVS|nr:hypothetical protein [Archaeoglobus veneficus]AEA46282.1 hypothetical protein Arcve_0245 [Archaeoglobus veneficus SNP6]
MVNLKTGIAVLIISSVVAATIAALVVFFSRVSPNKILPAAVILILFSVAVFGAEIYRQKRKLERLDKGRKLAEVRYRLIRDASRDLRYAEYFFIGTFAFAFLLYLIAKLNPVMYASLFFIFALNLITFFKERKYGIYERGIVYGLRFIEWRDVAGYEVEDDYIEIEVRGTPAIKIRIRDEGGVIRNVLKKFSC